ncbi:hypothetical protein Tco_1193675 [Tanacetum coccineum]
MMDNPNITMEEYIRIEEEKARKHGKVFNWETAKYGKIWCDEDVHDLRSIENEFPAIVFNDNLTSNQTLSCEPMVSSLNDNEIDFRISFDESDDEDYTDVRSLCGLVERSMTDQGRFSTWMINCMAQLMEASGQTYQAFDGTFRGSSPAVFERRTRQRTGDASTSTAPQQPDP